MASPHITIVIVNYNVKEYVASLLISIENAKHDLVLETIVVDNASTDGSQEFLTSRFPNVLHIHNSVNVGFGKANNQAIRTASGTYTLIINPDTLIQENTLTTLYAHMEANPSTAAAGCKLLNPDGTFAPESKRSIPTPLTALYKVLGFGSDYYMSAIGEDEAAPIPVLSGAFMFCRTSVLQSLDGFDERFFMYGEDIDLCYRMTQAGHLIDYVPGTAIIHYKGESTKKDNLDYVILFNKAMYQFFEKHYSAGYTFWLKVIVKAGIILRGMASYLATVVKRLAGPALDLSILNLILVVLFMLRYGIAPSAMPESYQPGFVLLHILSSLLFFSIAKFHDLHGLNRKSFSALFQTTAFTFATLAFITFFLRDYAFSRWILLLGFVSSTILLSLLRLFLPGFRGNLSRTRMLIVGVGPQTSDLVRLIRSKVDWNADIVGILIQKESTWTDTFEDIPIIGRPEHAPDLIRFHKIDQVLFSGNAIQTGDMLSVMSQIRNPLVSVKLVPESMDFVIGKSNVEYLDDIAVVDVDIPYTRAWNRFLKRNLDVAVSAVVLLITCVPGSLAWLLALLRGKQRDEVRLYAEEHHATTIRLFKPHASNVWLNRFLLFGYVFSGKLSLVGAPLHPDRHPLPVYCKPGLTGLRQLNEDRLKTTVEKEHYERHYVQNHSIWLDIGILFNSLIAGRFYDGRL